MLVAKCCYRQHTDDDYCLSNSSVTLILEALQPHLNSFSADVHLFTQPHHLHVLSQDCRPHSRVGCAPQGCINIPLDSSTHWAAPCSPTQAQVNYLSSVQLLSWSGKMFQLIRIIISKQQCIVVSWSLGCHPAKVTDSSQTALPQKHLHISGSGPQEPIVSVDIPNLQRD